MATNKQQDGEELSEGMGPATPGGVYEDAPGAGTFHDAHGRAVSKDGTLLAGDEIPGAVNADQAWRKDMEKQREASAASGEGESEPTPKARKRG